MRKLLAIGCLCGAALTWAAPVTLVAPAEVQRQIDAGEKITFIDVRSTALFKDGHVPGAINVPAALVPQKQLPPLGAVVVYDGGLGTDSATEAAAALGKKPGITPRILEGGFAAWEAARANTTKGGGLKPEDMPLITYTDLSKVQGDDVVLVDLRKEPKQVRQGAGTGPAPEPLTDLKQEFSKVRGVTRSPFNVPQSRQAVGGGSTTPLLVLIDNGDGSAQAMARDLKANGVTRFAILAGGEQIIARKGRAGSGRTSSTIVVHRPPGSLQNSTNR
jgi:rhodanese-related sulfurtransferase